MAFNLSGALAGLGRGITQTGDRMSVALEKKKERDFMAQQSAITAERNMALQKRREEHDITMKGMEQEFSRGERVAGQEFTKEQTKAAQDFATGERVASQEFKRNLSEDQQKALFAQEEKLLQMKLDAAKDLEEWKISAKAGQAGPRTPKEAEWKTAQQIADNLLMEEKITVEQYANTVREAAYGLLDDPRGRASAVPSGGKYEKSDVIGLMKLSEEERAQELQGIRDREGEEAFRRAVGDLREYSIQMKQKSKDPTLIEKATGAIGQGARSALAFGQRNVEGGYEKPEEELNPKELYLKLREKYHGY